MFFRRIFKGSSRGVTLLELVFVTIIGLIVVMMAVSIMAFGSQMAAAASTQTRLNAMAQAKIERLKNDVRASASFTVTDGGDRLNITGLDGAVISYFYSDDDSTSETAWNNRLLLEVQGAESPQRVVSWIDRSGGAPLFEYAGGKSPLVIRMRLGEPVGGSRYRFTGAGTQALDVVTSVTSRNEGL